MLVCYDHFHFKFRENQEPDIKKYNRIILHGWYYNLHFKKNLRTIIGDK